MIVMNFPLTFMTTVMVGPRGVKLWYGSDKTQMVTNCAVTLMTTLRVMDIRVVLIKTLAVMGSLCY